jgi:hypothetical protein
MRESHSPTDKNQFKFGIGDIVRFNRLYKDFYVYVADGQYVEITSLDADRGYGMKIVPKHKNSKTMYVPRMFVDACCKKAQHRFNVGDVVKFTHEFRNFAGSLKIQYGATAKIKEAYLTGGYVLEFDSGVETPFDPDWVDQHCELHNASHDVNEDRVFSSCKFVKGDTIQFKFTSDRNLIEELNSLSRNCGVNILMGNVAKVTGISLLCEMVIYYIKFSTIDRGLYIPKETLECLCEKLPDHKFEIGDIIVCTQRVHTLDGEFLVAETGYTTEIVNITDGYYVLRSLIRKYDNTAKMFNVRFNECEKCFKKLEL